MTITYTAEVATCKWFGFLQLLARWKGSIYKLVWMDLIAFLSLYYMLNFLYRFALNAEWKAIFENIVIYCNSYSTLIPLSFVLGFYVSVVMQRWWDQYLNIPWPDPIAVFVSAHVHGQDERGRVMRRTVMRYVCLCQTIVLTMISPRVKKRFPTMSHLVEAGLLLENEKQIIDDMDNAFPKHPKHWMPIVWAASIITRARKENRIRDDFAVKTIIDELNKFRGMCGVLMYYDTISIPLVYTQVVTLAVYSYFLCALMGQQWTERVDSKGHRHVIDLYFPVFTTLQFFFYMGWLKVAESLINPFGDDDDDFEVNWMIDRNLQVSYLIVDEMHHEHPELVKDQYWDEVFPNELPYSVAMEARREEPPEPSTAKLDISKQEAALSTVKVASRTPSQTRLLGKTESSYSAGSLWSNGLKRTPSDISDRRKHLSVVAEEKTQQQEQQQLQPPLSSHPSKASDIRTPEDTPHISEVPSSEISPEASGKLHFEKRSNISQQRPSAHLKDEFELLKEERERERLERQRQKLARNLTQAANLNMELDNASEVNIETAAPEEGATQSHQSPRRSTADPVRRQSEESSKKRKDSTDQSKEPAPQ